MASEKLSNFLREVSNWSWEEFARAEKDMSYSSNQSIIFALVRACVLEKMDAIKVATNRLDGKLKTPIKIEYPKVIWLYPYANLPDGEMRKIGEWKEVRVTDDPTTVNEVEAVIEDEALPVVVGELLAPPDIAPHPERDLPSMGLRETLTEMGEFPRELPEAIVALALQTEQWIRHQADQPSEIPKVKSVVAAHLLAMAQNRNMDAIGEVFDAIDGKLVETIQILGDDLYLTSYATTAPEGAVRNADGIMQLEATDSQNTWARKLGKETE